MCVQSGISKPLPIVVVRDPTDDNTMSLHEKAMRVVEQYRAEARHHQQLRDEHFNKAKEAFQKGRTAIASYYFQMVSEMMKGLINLIYRRLTFMTGIHGFRSPSRKSWYHTFFLLHRACCYDYLFYSNSCTLSYTLKITSSH